MRSRRAALALLALAAFAPPAGAARFAKGEEIVVTGVVTDGEGRPLPGLQVVFEAARATWSVRTLRRETRDAARVSTTTNERGEYSLEWTWNEYYNRFELQAATPVRRGEREELRVLAREDLTRRLAQRSPVVVALAVEDTSFLEALRSFLPTVDSDDERRVYAAMGSPDSVDTLDTPRRAETTWWYFAAGKAYRFRDGRLVDVESFDPIEPF